MSPGEAPKGPSLLGIAARYSRAELTESILKPSAKIAQGFEPQKFATVDGRTYEGFVVRESGDEVEMRDVQGGATILSKKDIDDRAKGEVSIMPTGLADSVDDPGLRLVAGLSGIAEVGASSRHARRGTDHFCLRLRPTLMATFRAEFKQAGRPSALGRSRPLQ